MFTLFPMDKYRWVKAGLCCARCGAVCGLSGVTQNELGVAHALMAATHGPGRCVVTEEWVVATYQAAWVAAGAIARALVSAKGAT
ncbi:MAG: hypothetical protein JNM98_21670 [Rhodocyclaceae bacterium]|nr:hypothetical protein [Rhodocyclaceae bacterium]